MTQDQAIAEITRRLVDYYHPERIYLFGSAARGDGGPDSDLDFGVVLPDEAPPAFYRPGAHRALWDVGTAADVVRWSASDFDMRAAHVKASLPAAILREEEGRLTPTSSLYCLRISARRFARYSLYSFSSAGSRGLP